MKPSHIHAINALNEEYMNEIGQPRTRIHQIDDPFPLTREEAPAYLSAIQEECTRLSDSFHSIDPTYVEMKNNGAFENLPDMDAFVSPLHAAHCYSILLADRVGALASTIQPAVEILSDYTPEELGDEYPAFARLLSATRQENIDALFRRATTVKQYIPEGEGETYSWKDMMEGMKNKLNTAFEAGEITEPEKDTLTAQIHAIEEKLETLPRLESILTGQKTQATPALSERISRTAIAKLS